MLVFEYLFNPKKINGWKFDSFCYEPETEKEKSLGSLYFVGEIASDIDSNFLDNLAQQTKDEYYNNKQNFGPEKKFQSTLKKTNNFLLEKIKAGGIDLLDNLNFGALNIVLDKNSWNLNFTKTGNIKILLIRNNEISDITLNLEDETATSETLLTQVSPNKILNHKQFFGNIASGKLYENDKILVLTKNVFSAVKKQGVLKQISGLSPFSERKMKKILKKNKNIFSEISGAFLLISAEPEQKSESAIMPTLKFPEPENKKQIFEMNPRKIDLSRFGNFKLCPFPAPKGKQRLKNFREKLNFKNLRISSLPTPHIRNLFKKPRPQIKLFGISKFANLNNKLKQLITDLKELPLSKNLGFITALILILLIGSFVFKSDERKENKDIKQKLEQIETKINQAESFIIIQEDEQAIILFQEIWNEILPLTETENPSLKQEALSLQKIVEKQLDPLNKIERIQNPTIYNGEETIFEDLHENFELKSWNIYRNNIYFLDSAQGKILKYALPDANLENLNLSNPKIWLKSNTLINAKSIAVDGSVWILNRDNQIEKYYAGKLQKTLELNFFPVFRNPEKIYTSPALLYIFVMEPCENRIVLLDKEGKIKKQLISEKFNNLSDFAISADAKIIYLLSAPSDDSDAIIYEIEIQT
jgi:hypothetical protein